VILQELKKHLELNKEKLFGDWVKRNSSYDCYICDRLCMDEDTVRYWDAVWKGQPIEFKKGKSIWLDLVRFSEAFLKCNPEASKETLTLFFIPNKAKDRIEQIVCVETYKLIEHIGLNREQAKQLVELNASVPRSLNVQTSLTPKDVRNIATFIV
jgi:hypothetical protein